MSEADPDIVFFRSLQRAREKEDKPNPSIPVEDGKKDLDFEKRFEARRKEKLEEFRDWTYDGWKTKGWKQTGEKIEPVLHAVLMSEFAWGVGMVELGTGFRISSGTVYNHIKKHNREVKRLGSCGLCIRGIPYAGDLIDIFCESEVQLGMRLREEMRIEDKVRDLSRDESDAVIEEWCAERFDPLEAKYRHRT